MLEKLIHQSQSRYNFLFVKGHEVILVGHLVQLNTKSSRYVWYFASFTFGLRYFAYTTNRRSCLGKFCHSFVPIYHWLTHLPVHVHPTICACISRHILTNCHSLCILQEGPMIHSGSVVAAGISQGRISSLNIDFHVCKLYLYYNIRVHI